VIFKSPASPLGWIPKDTTWSRSRKPIPDSIVYLLVIAKNGPKIHAVDEGDCPEVPNQQNPCRSLRNTKFGQLTGEKAPMAALTLTLSAFTQTIIVDKTGLKGSFSFKLDWTPFLEPPPSRGGEPPPPPGAFDPASVEPAIAAALQEQLGLKLESGKGPVAISRSITSKDPPKTRGPSGDSWLPAVSCCCRVGCDSIFSHPSNMARSRLAACPFPAPQLQRLRATRRSPPSPIRRARILFRI
jgi:hypothetical protein